MRRIISVMRNRRIVGVSGGLALLGGVLLPVSAAHAVTPDHGSFSETRTFVDSEVCAPEGFNVDVIETESGRYTVFYDNDGTFSRAIVHITYVATISANGHTIYEKDHFQEYFYADGTSKTVGLTVHIKGDTHGKPVQLDAGAIVFNPDGSVAAIHGPHPQFQGQTFCFALVP